VRDHDAVGEARKVVVERPLALLGQQDPRPVEVADQLPLLGVDAQGRVPGVQELLPQPGDVAGLRVAVPAVPHRDILLGLAAVVVVRVEQLLGDVDAHRCAPFGHPLGDVRGGQVGPD
jgi:hypothetical protein